MEVLKNLEFEYPVKFYPFKNGYYIEAFPLDYKLFLKLQSILTELVTQHKDLVFLILCNHTNLLTMGKGDRQNVAQNNFSTVPKGIEFHEINRGGGLTFHGPNQFIFYPILKLGPKSFPLKHHIEHMMGFFQNILQEEFEISTEPKIDPLGLWIKDTIPVTKLASLGIGVKKWVTQHGLALNIAPITFSEEQFQLFSPCGLSSNVYGYAQNYNPIINVPTFLQKVKARIIENTRWPY